MCKATEPLLIAINKILSKPKFAVSALTLWL